MLEDVDSDPTSKVVEDLEQILTDQGDAERYFLVGTSLGPKEKDLVWLLKQNIEVFAWMPYEMPGINPQVIEHQLNISPDTKPIIQHPRRSTYQYTEAIEEDVEKLLEV